MLCPVREKSRKNITERKMQHWINIRLNCIKSMRESRTLIFTKFQLYLSNSSWILWTTKATISYILGWNNYIKTSFRDIFYLAIAVSSEVHWPRLRMVCTRNSSSLNWQTGVANYQSLVITYKIMNDSRRSNIIIVIYHSYWIKLPYLS